ncbi:MAG: hypothetical protein HXY51_18025 [Nitrospirae bacterium]|nr:hypothetical protein [Nitrospirota bacterium]
MEKGAERIAQDMRDIAQTRVAIAEKLGAIEHHVGRTMQHARTTMTELADKTTSTVRETVQETKEALDPSVHVTRHPWISVGGAVCLGYAVGAIYRRGWRITTGIAPYNPQGVKGAALSDHEGGERCRTNPSTIWVGVERALQDELGVAKNGIIRFGQHLIREMIRQAVPALMQLVGGHHREENPRSASDPPRQ